MFFCSHCGKEDFDFYMLKNEIWRRVSISGKGTLHLKCVEILLGRRLTSEDFKPIAMNDAIIYLLKRDE